MVDQWGGTKHALTLMEWSAEKYPCFYTPGNHEYERDDTDEFFKLALERKYELSPYGSSGIYTKGGMYGQLLCLSPERRIAFGWHGYETANDVRIVLKQFDR